MKTRNELIMEAVDHIVVATAIAHVLVFFVLSLFAIRFFSDDPFAIVFSLIGLSMLSVRSLYFFGNVIIETFSQIIHSEQE